MYLSENIKAYNSSILELFNSFGIENGDVKICLGEMENLFELKVVIDNVVYNKKEIYSCIDDNEKKKLLKKTLFSNLYLILSNLTGKKLSWGALTGVMPVKLFYNHYKKFQDINLSMRELKRYYHISDKKLNLLGNVIKNQMMVIEDNSCCLYVHIPICPSRCVYCSFVSTDFTNAHKYLDQYVENLKLEIDYTIKKCCEKNLKINSIYVGGGTPTVLNAEQLEYLLTPLSNLNFKEFTVECGRPETITIEKLQVLEMCKVTRISINPQTFNDDILKTIGRNHTCEDTLKAMQLAKSFKFSINMDLIAGLPNDTFENFTQTIHKVIELEPDNITIHTLSIKNAGILKYMDNAELPNTEVVEKMIDYSNTILSKKEYLPYYLYRQKNMTGSFENVGYSKEGKFCLFNIYSMEDLKQIIACGAGAISKKINFETGEIERVTNFKQISEYLQRFDEILKKKDYLLA